MSDKSKTTQIRPMPLVVRGIERTDDLRAVVVRFNLVPTDREFAALEKRLNEMTWFYD